MQLSNSIRCSLAVMQFPSIQGFFSQTASVRKLALGSARKAHEHLHCGNRSYSVSPTLYASKSTFEPPEPPAFTGQPVFPDVDINSVGEGAAGRNQDEDAVFVVTGASRGIGLQMIKELLDRTKGKIVACCRSPSSAEGLQLFITSLPQEMSDRISVRSLDLENQESIEELAESIKSSYNRIDVLLNVAGILGDGSTTPGPERSIRMMDREWATKSFNVNYMGPIFLSQACAPMMRKKRNEGHSVIANLSARVGSISDNGLGGWISYRSSKAALNQATRTMALELKRQNTFTVALHPGTTDTDLSKPFQANVREDRLFPVEFTAARLLDVVDCMGLENSGGLYDWSGTALPF